VLQSPGLRISLAGAAIFAFGLISLLFLPVVIGLVCLLVGGFAVWGGFIRTLFSYYGPSGDDTADVEQ
jgi:hypothetical protein